MFNKGSDAQGTCRGPWVLGCVKVPDFNFSVVGSGDNAFVIKADATDKFFVAFKHSETGSTFNVPQSDGVVRGSADYQVVVILQTGDASLVTVERAYKLAG